MHALLLTLPLAVLSQWQSQGTRQGLTLETHAVDGSAYEAIRVTGTSPAPPDIQIAEMWGVSTKEGMANASSIGEHKVLEETETHRTYYQTVVAPLISTRDYVITFDRVRVNDGWEIQFHTADDPRYPVSTERVRMKCNGVARVLPTATGGSTVVYELHVDLQGSVPAFIARGAQRDSALEWVKVMVTRGEKHMAGLAGAPTAK